MQVAQLPGRVPGFFVCAEILLFAALGQANAVHERALLHNCGSVV
jgi:hypothetical protein